jgi:adenylate cyclase
MHKISSRAPERGAMSETRKLAAILAADVVGFSRLAGVGEEGTLARLRSLRTDLIDPAIAAHRGRVVKRTGDGAIVEFRSVVDAVRCAMDLQTRLAAAPGGDRGASGAVSMTRRATKRPCHV